MKTGFKPYWVGGCLLALSACGGGGSSSPSSPPPPSPPPPVNQAPSFTSASSVTMTDNKLGDVYTLEAADSDGTVARMGIVTSADANVFTFNTATGVLSLGARLDFDNPADADGNNVYALSFEAEDNEGAVSTLDVLVTVTASLLDAALPPSGNFELIDWKLDLPIDENGNLSGDNDNKSETELANGYESEYFFTGADGGLVIKAPVIGAKTPNSSFTRTELREMLRRGDTSISTRDGSGVPNENNWAFSSQPQAAQDSAGGIDGTLRVKIAVNNVTTTGTNSHIGRLIIGQIHARGDEPIRLYYRKLPGNERGSIYAAHEINGGDDLYTEIIGSRDNDASNPSGGFLLNEQFTYEIIANGNTLTVNILNAADTQVATADIDMSASGYDILNDFMYFKAGAYHVNNTANVDEFAQVTIYELINTHDGYPF